MQNLLCSGHSSSANDLLIAYIIKGFFISKKKRSTTQSTDDWISSTKEDDYVAWIAKRPLDNFDNIFEEKN